LIWKPDNDIAGAISRISMLIKKVGILYLDLQKYCCKVLIEYLKKCPPKRLPSFFFVGIADWFGQV